MQPLKTFKPTAQQACTNAVNEYIADQQERHGRNQFVRDEACQTIAKLELMADKVRVLVGSYVPEDELEDAADGILAYLVPDSEERYLAACMVSALREKEDEVKEISK